MSILDDIGNMFSSFMHPERGYEEAQSQLENYFNQAKGVQQPFINQGLEQYGNLTGAQNQLMNPQGLLNQWTQGYQASPYAQQSLANAQSSGLNAASSQGLLGSSAATQNIQNSAHNIMNQDRSQYLQDLMQKYLAGVGIGKDIYGTGANQAANFGNLANTMGTNIAQLAGAGENAPGNLLDQLLKLAVNTGTSIYTGGRLGQNALGGIGGNSAGAGSAAGSAGTLGSIAA